MAITFDHPNQRIVLTSPTTSVTMQELINAIREEEESERGITYPSIATASGKDALGGGVYIAITVNLKDPWQIEPYAGAYTLSIGEGNLVSSRADGDVTYFISGSPQIEIRSSAAGVISVVSSGSGLSAEQDATLTAILADTADIQPKIGDPRSGNLSDDLIL